MSLLPGFIKARKRDDDSAPQTDAVADSHVTDSRTRGSYDAELDDKLRVYDSGAQLAASREAMYRTFVEYRTGDVLIPKLEKGEALAVEMKHFVNVIRGLEAPISGGELGIEVVRVIEAAQRSLRNGGAAVEVEA